MNMAKLGIVSQGEIFYKISGMQHLLGIMRISGGGEPGTVRGLVSPPNLLLTYPNSGRLPGRSSSVSTARFFLESGSYVIPGQSLMGEPSKSPQNHSQSLTACASRPKFKTVPPFADHFNGFAGRFLPGFGCGFGRLS